MDISFNFALGFVNSETAKRNFFAYNSRLVGDILEKIIDGKMGKYYSENCLMEQPFVKDDSQKVSQVIGDKFKIVLFWNFFIFYLLFWKISIKKARNYKLRAEKQAKIRVIITTGFKAGAEETLHDVALQIAASKPYYLASGDVPAEVLDRRQACFLPLLLQRCPLFRGICRRAKQSRFRS